MDAPWWSHLHGHRPASRPIRNQNPLFDFYSLGRHLCPGGAPLVGAIPMAEAPTRRLGSERMSIFEFTAPMPAPGRRGGRPLVAVTLLRLPPLPPAPRLPEGAEDELVMIVALIRLTSQSTAAAYSSLSSRPRGSKPPGEVPRLPGWGMRCVKT